VLKFILIILDGYGLRKEKDNNAAALAKTPNLDRLIENFPSAEIQTSGKHVGLPDGIMGNSEVGHMNIGAGRIIKQSIVKINESIENNNFESNKNLKKLFHYVKNNDGTLHLLGLLSDGGVHSHINHFIHIIKLAKDNNIKKLSIHAITDGRDTSPSSSLGYLNKIDKYLKKMKMGKISSICGRYYAMDRDNRWDRIEKAYNLYVNGVGEKFNDFNKAIEFSYSNKISDEFITPKVLGSPSTIKSGDGLLTMNFRADRMRQICNVFKHKSFKKFNTKEINFLLTSMTRYHNDFTFPVLFDNEPVINTFPEVLSKNKFKQLRVAETEKYAHVTYFLNGGREPRFKGEERILIPSPQVLTYDLKPEMSANEITKSVSKVIDEEKYNAIIINYANPDMVGHTGNLKAAIKAMETIDKCIGQLLSKIKNSECAIFLTADHGNLESMVDEETGEIHTSHTTLPVPFIVYSNQKKYEIISKGKLADIAPTILDYLDIPIPKEMLGKSLLLK